MTLRFSHYTKVKPFVGRIANASRPSHVSSCCLRRTYATRPYRKAVSGATTCLSRTPNPFQGQDDMPSPPSAALSADLEKDSGALDTFYKYYLEDLKPSLVSRRPPCHWLSTLDFGKCQNSLPPSLAKNPLHVFMDATRDHGLVSRCLETFIAGAHKDTPMKEARATFREGKPGSKALKWLLTDAQSLDNRDSGMLLHYIVHCLVAESSEKLIWQWLAVEHKLQIQSPGHVAISWKGVVGRALIENKTFWTDQRPAINAGLAEFIRLDAFDRQRAGSQKIMLQFAATWLIKQFTRHQYLEVDDALYKRYIGLLNVWVRDPHDRAFSKAFLHLRDPNRPDPLPALQFIKRYDVLETKPVFIEDLFNPKHWRVASRLYWFLVETAQALFRDGHKSEARYILDFGRRTIPQCFEMQGSRRYRGRNKDQPLRWGFLEARKSAAEGSDR